MKIINVNNPLMGLFVLVMLTMHTTNARRQSRGNETLSSIVTSDCTSCDQRACAIISADACDGFVVKDDCDCCPVCRPITEAEENDLLLDQENDNNMNSACKEVTCSRYEICMLNIQGLPVCRCPTAYYCKNRPRGKVCSESGETFNSICHLKMAACTENRRISIAKNGPCRTNADVATMAEKRQMRIEARKSKRLERMAAKQRNREIKQELKRQQRLQLKAEGRRDTKQEKRYNSRLAPTTLPSMERTSRRNNGRPVGSVRQVSPSQEVENVEPLNVGSVRPRQKNRQRPVNQGLEEPVNSDGGLSVYAGRPNRRRLSEDTDSVVGGSMPGIMADETINARRESQNRQNRRGSVADSSGRFDNSDDVVPGLSIYHASLPQHENQEENVEQQQRRSGQSRRKPVEDQSLIGSSNSQNCAEAWASLRSSGIPEPVDDAKSSQTADLQSRAGRERKARRRLSGNQEGNADAVNAVANIRETRRQNRMRRIQRIQEQQIQEV